MKTVTNLYILNLAFADEIFLVGLPILIYTMHLNEWMFDDIFCKLYMISTSITQFTSSIFLVIMSADRFILLIHPIKFNHHLMKLQIYCRLSSYQLSSFPYTVGVESGLLHCMVHLSYSYASADSLLVHHHLGQRQKNLQHCVAFWRR